MKTYSVKTKQIAANAVLEAAVEEAIGLLKPATYLDRIVPDSHLVENLMPRIEDEILLSAARSANLLMRRAG